jgi:hypothetical protein
MSRPARERPRPLERLRAGRDLDAATSFPSFAASARSRSSSATAPCPPCPGWPRAASIASRPPGSRNASTARRRRLFPRRHDPPSAEPGSRRIRAMACTARAISAAAVADAGAELILHGHSHKSTIYAIPGKDRMATCPSSASPPRAPPRPTRRTRSGALQPVPASSASAKPGNAPCASSASSASTAISCCDLSREDLLRSRPPIRSRFPHRAAPAFDERHRNLPLYARRLGFTETLTFQPASIRCAATHPAFQRLLDLTASCSASATSSSAPRSSSTPPPRADRPGAAPSASISTRTGWASSTPAMSSSASAASRSTRCSTGARRRRPALPDRVLLPIGGGKDSLVSVALLEAAGVEFTPSPSTPRARS